jgi:GPH family glycoside/pentoside/hexuronide:cation symporter
MLLATIVGRVGAAINQVAILWFFAFAMGLGAAGGLPLLVYLITAVLGAPVWIWLGDRWMKHRALAFATLTSVAIFMTLFLVPSGDLVTVCVIMAIAGIAASAAGTLGLSMAADTIDLDYLRSGENRAGLLLSFWAFGQKFADAIGAGIAGAMLGYIGFDPNIANSADVLFGLKVVYIIVPGILFFASVPFYWNFPITPEKQKRIRTVLDHRAAKQARRAA